MEDDDQDKFSALARCGHPFGKELPAGIDVSLLWRRALMEFFRKRGVAPEEAEDKAHNILIIVIHSTRLPETTEAARNYVWGIAGKVWLQRCARAKRNATLDTTENHSAMISPPISTDKIAVRKWWEKVRKRVRKKFGTAAVEFALEAFVEELSGEELAFKYQMTNDAARQLKARLKEYLQKEALKEFGGYLPFNIEPEKVLVRKWWKKVLKKMRKKFGEEATQFALDAFVRELSCATLSSKYGLTQEEASNRKAYLQEEAIKEFGDYVQFNIQ